VVSARNQQAAKHRVEAHFWLALARTVIYVTYVERPRMRMSKAANESQ
jgi:hypothetical protein